MNLINSIYESTKSSFRKSFRQFPITLTTLALFILLMVFGTEMSYTMKNEPRLIDDWIIPTLITAALGFFLTEAASVRNRGAKIAMVAVSVGIAVLFTCTLVSRNPLGLSETHLAATRRILSFYIILCAAAGACAILKKSRLPIDAFGARLYAHGFAAAIVMACFSIGILLVTIIFNALFLSDGSAFLERMWIFCALTSAVTVIFYAIEALDQKPGKFFAAIAQFVLLPVSVLAFIIIYGYIAKILITRIIPSNEIFPILSGLFIVGMPIWTINRDVVENEKLNKFVDLLALFFIPFIGLQIWSLSLRISAFGLTTTRYLGCVLILLEVVYFLLYIFNARKTESTLIAVIFAALIAFVIPGINAYSLPFRQQLATLNAYVENPASFDADNEYRVIGAYNYLKNEPGGEEALAAIDDQTIAGIKSLRIAKAEGSNYYHFWSEGSEKIDVRGFSAIIPNVSCDSGNESKEIDLSAVACYDASKWKHDSESDPEPLLTIDVQEIYRKYSTVQAAEDGRIEPTEIALENGDVFRLESFGFEIGEDGELRSFYASGVFLEK